MTSEAFAGTGEDATEGASTGGESLVAIATRQGMPNHARVGDEVSCRIRAAGAAVEATLIDTVPRGCPVRPVRAADVDRARNTVVLGGVSPEPPGGDQIFEYRVTIPDSATPGAIYTLGPAEAIAIVDGEWASETVTGAARFKVVD